MQELGGVQTLSLVICYEEIGLLPSLPAQGLSSWQKLPECSWSFSNLSVFNGTYIVNTVKLLKYLFYSIILTYIIMHLVSSYLPSFPFEMQKGYT